MAKQNLRKEMESVLQALGLKDINNGVSTGLESWKPAGSRLESQSPVDGELIASVVQANKDDYEKVMVEQIKEESISHMNQIVQGYQENGMKEIGEQEITFVCKEYYLIDDAFLHKMIEWLESK